MLTKTIKNRKRAKRTVLQHQMKLSLFQAEKKRVPFQVDNICPRCAAAGFVHACHNSCPSCGYSAACGE